MKCDLNCFDPNSILWAVFQFRFSACIQIQSFSGHFIFLHLSTLPRPDFPGSHGVRKHYRLVLFWVRVLQSFYFYVFFHGICKPCNDSYILEVSTNEGPGPKCLETELTNITRRHFCSLPVFCIKHSFIYFIYFLLSEFFSVVCLFWHTLTARDDTHATTHVTGTQIIHAKMASLNAIFCRGNKSSSRPLTHFCSRKQKIYRLRFVLIKKFELNL